MTVLEAIQQADLQVPNGFSQEEKLRWLSYVDGMLHEELHRLYEGAAESFSGYDSSTGPDMPLLAEEPYARELYLRFLESRMDDANGDTERFINSQQLFQAAYMNYARWYNRCHTPRSRERKYQ